MKKVYVIYKRGIYGHGVHGIFTSRIDAENMADKIASKDKDSYHTWQVFKIPMNTVCSAKHRGFDGFTHNINNRDLLYETKSWLCRQL